MIEKKKSLNELKLTDFLEKPISNNILLLNKKNLIIDLKKIVFEIFSGTVIELIYEDDEIYISLAFIYDYYYEDLLYKLGYKEDHKFFEFSNLFDLIFDFYDLNLRINVCSLACYGDTVLYNDELNYVAYLNCSLSNDEYNVFERWRNKFGFVLYDKYSILIGDYEEFDETLVFISSDYGVIDYIFIDNIYADNFDLSELSFFRDYLIQNDKFNLLSFKNNEVKDLFNFLKKYRRETREIIY